MSAILAQLLVVTCLSTGECRTIRFNLPMPLAQCQMLETETQNKDGDYAESVCVLVGKDA